MPREIGQIRASAERGERLSLDDRAALMADEAHRVRDKILAAMKRDRSDPERQQSVSYRQGSADAVRTAVGILAVEMMAVSLAHTMRREQLEDRIAALEATLAEHAGDNGKLRTIAGGRK